MSEREFDQSRLAALFHYVISRVGARPGFGATKLYKVAWFSDARQHMLTGRSITGAQYIKEEFGPVPAMARAVRSALVARGDISEWRDKGLFGEPWKFESLQQPDPNVFSSDELKCINYWAIHIADDHTAQSISEESHDYGWEIAALKEPLPFHAFLAERTREPNEDELEWAKQAAGAKGLI